MATANGVNRYRKPYATFPLTPHKRGWCKKISGKVVIICGHLPPKEALAIYVQKMPRLHATSTLPEASSVTQQVMAQPPRELPVACPPVSVTEVKDRYLAVKERELRAGMLKDRSYMSLMEILPQFTKTMAKSAADLTPQDFADYRLKLALKYSAYSLDRHITNIRAMFNWAVRNGVINALPKWGDSFEKPSLTQKRKHRHAMVAKNGKRMFANSDVRRLLAAANPVMKAMVYLGINCGMGNTDIAELPRSALDLVSGILEYPRPKTSQERRAILWPETVEAIRQALQVRPEPADLGDHHLVFLTPEGRPWVHNELKEQDGKVAYFAPALRGMCRALSEMSGLPVATIWSEFKAVFARHGSIEYSFALQELPSVLAMHPGVPAAELVRQYRPVIDVFQHRRRMFLRPYPGVQEGIESLHQAGYEIFGVTDSRRFQAQNRLKQLRLDQQLDGLCCVADHAVPDAETISAIRLHPDDHYTTRLSNVIVLPDGLRKPSPGVIDYVVSSLNIECSACIYVGDSLSKDVAMAQRAGVYDCWASYGANVSPLDFATLVRVTDWSRSAVDDAMNPSPERLGIFPSYTANSFDEVVSLALMEPGERPSRRSQREPWRQMSLFEIGPKLAKWGRQENEAVSA